MQKDWSPFWVDSSQQLAPRPFIGPQWADGVGDRLRAAAFAEVQAEAAFRWAAEYFKDEAPAELCRAWLELADEENKHLSWLLKRLSELKISLHERPVSDALWYSLVRQKTARDFCHYMAGAEERGRRAGERFGETLKTIDPVSAEIFSQIAREEVRHIALAYEFYPVLH